MATPNSGQLYEHSVVHTVARTITAADKGKTLPLGPQVPPCDILRIYRTKKTDFGFGSTATYSVGIDYSDGTSDSTTALTAAIDLTSGTAQGTVAAALTDSAAARIEQHAQLTVTVVATGTASTTGLADVIVEYIPLARVQDSGFEPL